MIRKEMNPVKNNDYHLFITRIRIRKHDKHEGLFYQKVFTLRKLENIIHIIDVG